METGPPAEMLGDFFYPGINPNNCSSCTLQQDEIIPLLGIVQGRGVTTGEYNTAVGYKGVDIRQ